MILSRFDFLLLCKLSYYEYFFATHKNQFDGNLNTNYEQMNGAIFVQLSKAQYYSTSLNWQTITTIFYNSTYNSIVYQLSFIVILRIIAF